MNRFLRGLRKMRVSGRNLRLAGGSLFVISLFLPAITVLSTLPGWYCAWIVLGLLWSCLTQNLKEIPGNWQMIGFALSNFLALGSLFLFLDSNNRRGLRVMAWLFFLSALSAAWMMKSDFSSLCVGYYAWLGSFGLLSAGFALQSMEKQGKGMKSGVSQAYVPKTPEEMAAERELKEYLRSGL